MPKCHEVMTKDPVCCEPGDPVTRAAEMMRSHDVGSLPVVETIDSRRVIGIVTDRDVVTKVVASNRNVSSATVNDAMTKNPAVCREDDDLERAMSLMADHQVRRMPVVDASGRLSGIIAQADVATRGHREERTGELVEAISEPSKARR
ncbi:MAG TPA: CBS domain-containing protein [Vicinamibacterales bacterium]|jgi:CBS domain-containing protein|nr:CBS domain-containing protein [Vicinamibacterales bacterium]